MLGIAQTPADSANPGFLAFAQPELVAALSNEPKHFGVPKCKLTLRLEHMLNFLEGVNNSLLAKC
jgi:hypothetical protein